MVDREELQRLARMVDLNRQKMERIEEQLSKLEAIHQDQSHVVRAVRAIPDEGAEKILVPLGSGVQLVVDVQPDAGAVVDIGTAIQAEMTRKEAADLIEKRQKEISELIESLKQEFDSSEQTVRSLAATFNEGVATLEKETPTPEEPHPPEDELESITEDKPRSRRRRGIGGELTLDD
ncbi:MAG: prefoldin subunit alpha [Euryarchaeota archaeon]|nr:prefoldin subunit alpha [Euryarchaeota archaeon]|tara:strand:+ start:2601 stop:3134 length:534 start_codon:yes stop_codon:yes gene_type:complete